MKKQNFKQFLEENLNTAEFKNLHTNLEVSRKKFTRLLNQTDPFDFELTKKLLNVLNKQITSPDWFIENVNFFNIITLDQFQELKDWFFIYHSD